MKRYLVFGTSNYYPEGGWRDFVGHFNTLKEAVKKGLSLETEHYHVVDTKTTGRIIKYGDTNQELKSKKDAEEMMLKWEKENEEKKKRKKQKKKEK